MFYPIYKLIQLGKYLYKNVIDKDCDKKTLESIRGLRDFFDYVIPAFNEALSHLHKKLNGKIPDDLNYTYKKVFLVDIKCDNWSLEEDIAFEEDEKKESNSNNEMLTIDKDVFYKLDLFTKPTIYNPDMLKGYTVYFTYNDDQRNLFKIFIFQDETISLLTECSLEKIIKPELLKSHLKKLTKGIEIVKVCISQEENTYIKCITARGLIRIILFMKNETPEYLSNQDENSLLELVPKLTFKLIC
jgi:hypothetical protein